VVTRRYAIHPPYLVNRVRTEDLELKQSLNTVMSELHRYLRYLTNQVDRLQRQIHNELDERDAADAHPADAVTFSPAGTLESTDVQAALEEVDATYRPFARGGVVGSPTGASAWVVWRAPFACEVLNVRGYRVGGTGATINARRGSGPGDDHLASDLSLTSPNVWMDGGPVQNIVYAGGEEMWILITGITGTPDQVAIQVDLRRT
jgi:hypothetical protein